MHASMHEDLDLIPVPYKLGMVVYACNSSFWEVQARGSEVPRLSLASQELLGQPL